MKNMFYRDSKPRSHHPYLIGPLLEVLSLVKQAIPSQVRILDLGCGNGSLTSVIARHGYEMVGLDSSEAGIAIARQSFPECKFICSDIYDPPPKDLLQAFDIVLAVEVIEHLLYPRELVRYAKKCLKPNGRLILTTPYHGYLKNLALALTGKLDNHFTVLWDNGHVKFFSVPTLTALLKAEGCTDLQFKFAGRFPYFWKSMICSCRFAEEL
ncbi:MAG: class I SAM-dependent methyltransferase [Oscillatoriaceae bacterium SKW80]|nr:class I SAM-dependent methyltransferase [Oscillatoriaceae bacterium SKYG93]MCX8120057.1 class I SAM-dependent methyltransferase [Oscillatoriaceae bacterium SKW80]MDW8454061.1 class I SAM-dependent methyltransferase [Oscillatoriaceae cyanobacterium SKYGB_i_bin93]HIK29701.1 class I SAM-dependent methyltransferase [Oscillatoriaceae cyanobacterium M7585_C2015_266]